jgi:serine/threonine-protein kinase
MLALSAALDAPESDAPDLVGKVLAGVWEVVRHVAIGSMGHVYEVRHMDGGPARAAAKVLHTELVHNKEVAFRFRREAEILDAIHSPHVPRLFDRGRDEMGRPFFVIEYIAGRELFRVLEEQKTLPVQPALEITRQICQAIGAAHRAGIIHRDLKPENVMIVGSPAAPEVKILDFSVSKMDDISLTQAGTILGTPAYMPPEQALGQEITPKVDVYAVGVMLYDMLCGQAPFDEGEPGRTLGALLTRDAPRPRSLAPDLPEEVEAVILQAIAKDPAKRYASIDVLEGEIGLLLGTVSGLRRKSHEVDDEAARPTQVPAGATTQVAAAPKRRVAVATAFVVLLIAGLVVVAVRFFV